MFPPGIGLPTWQPDPALLGHLGGHFTAQGYRVRPPKGFAYEQQKSPSGPIHVWKNESLGNGRIVFFTAIVTTARPHEALLAVDDFVAGFFSGLKPHMKDWQQNPPERGQIAGMSFTRVTWSATETNLNRPTHGFVYAGARGPDLVCLAGMEHKGEPSVLPLLETAARAFSLP
jgi:hypothetical protein